MSKQHAKSGKAWANTRREKGRAQHVQADQREGLREAQDSYPLFDKIEKVFDENDDFMEVGGALLDCLKQSSLPDNFLSPIERFIKRRIAEEQDYLSKHAYNPEAEYASLASLRYELGVMIL